MKRIMNKKKRKEYCDELDKRIRESKKRDKLYERMKKRGNI